MNQIVSKRSGVDGDERGGPLMVKPTTQRVEFATRELQLMHWRRML